MSIIGSNILAGASGQATGYNLNNSLRFRSSASAYLSRTPSASNRATWTWSAWVKRGALSSTQTLFALFDYAGGGSTNNQQSVRFSSSDTLEFYEFVTPSYNGQKITTQVFRDPSAWYHIVAVWDTTQATASNRMKLYVNGTQITAFGTSSDPALNSNGQINRAFLTTIGGFYDPDFGAVTNLLDGYQAEINFIDGSAKTPSDFGETDTTTGSWKPKAYTGTYGTNGFYLKFADASAATAAAIGKDSSGNGNNWTPSGISVTAGTTYDAMLDVPTNTSATVANYAVLDPLDPTTSGNMTLSNANLTMTTSAANRSRLSTIYVPSGKWYAEIIFTTASGNLSGCMVGLCRSEDATSVVASYLGSSTNSYGYNQGGDKYNAGSGVAYGASYTTSDIIGIAFDTDAGTVTFYKNNTSQGTAFTGLSTSSLWAIGVSSGISSTSQNIVSNINFGQRPFTYTAPSGFVALNTYNLPDSTIVKGNSYMNAVTYTGSASNVTVTSGFYPDLTWAKSRNNTYNNSLVDSNRGGNSVIFSNSTSAQSIVSGLATFSSTGVTYLTGASGVNADASTNYILWAWNAGSGTNTTNTAGSITTTTSVSTTAGFSIIQFTGTQANDTIGHGLGVAPKMVIVKTYGGGTRGWRVYHESIGNTKYLILNDTSAATTDSTAWNNTTPTSTVISLGANGETNNGGSLMIAYAWAEIAGFSKFGSYTGNGNADGPFIYTGFRPKFVMWKRSDGVSDWLICDSSRNQNNVANLQLFPDTNDAEITSTTADFLSNGFKCRSLTTSTNGVSGGTYIYMAFAENPFKNANAR